MVGLLEENPNLASGHNYGLNKINVKADWNEIAASGNILGPTVRKIKKKLIHN